MFTIRFHELTQGAQFGALKKYNKKFRRGKNQKNRQIAMAQNANFSKKCVNKFEHYVRKLELREYATCIVYCIFLRQSTKSLHATNDQFVSLFVNNIIFEVPRKFYITFPCFEYIRKLFQQIHAIEKPILFFFVNNDCSKKITVIVHSVHSCQLAKKSQNI